MAWERAEACRFYPHEEQTITARTIKRAVLAGSLLTALLLTGSVLFKFLSIRRQDVVLMNGDIELAGTLAVPRFHAPPYPAVVAVHGSGRTTRKDLDGYVYRMARIGVATLVFDKRGVGESGGDVQDVLGPVTDDLVDRLASDVLAGVEFLKHHDAMDKDRIGLIGGSQAGWVMPYAAMEDPSVRFIVAISGPVVTFGQEDLYSQLTGDGYNRPSLPEDEIRMQMDEFQGPHGYDPMPTLSRLAVPSLWLLGAQDKSVPTSLCLRNLDEIGEPSKYIVYAGADHDLRDAQSGERIDYWADITGWLRENDLIGN